MEVYAFCGFLELLQFISNILHTLLMLKTTLTQTNNIKIFMPLQKAVRSVLAMAGTNFQQKMKKWPSEVVFSLSQLRKREYAQKVRKNPKICVGMHKNFLGGASPQPALALFATCLKWQIRFPSDRPAFFFCIVCLCIHLYFKKLP